MSTSGSSRRRSQSSSSARPAKKRATGKRGPAAIDAPFDERLLQEARRCAHQYALIVRREEHGYTCTTIEMPGVLGLGETVAEVCERTIELLITAIATMLEDGERPPAPASEQKRDQQVNIRLTAEEKLRLEEAARRDGFRGLSDYPRTAGLDRAG